MKNLLRNLGTLSDSQLHRLVLVCVVLGSILRLVWTSDMEWKGDEQHLFHIARNICPAAYPPVGIPSSKGIPNPGLSVWLVCAVGEVAESPLAMVRWIQWINVFALWGFWALFRFALPPAMGLVYSLGLGLFSVSLLPVLYSRKLWQQCLLAPFALVFFWGFLNRRRWWGAFLMGLIGAILPQVHMPAAYFVVGFVGLLALRDFRAKELRWSSVVSLGLGGMLGIVGLIPWFQNVIGSSFAKVSSEPLWRSVIKASFFWTWIAEAFGANVTHPLQHMFITDFAPLPRIVGIPTYLVFLACFGCIAIALMTLYRLFSQRSFWSSLFGLTRDSELEFLPKGILLGYGVIAVLSCSGMYPHYLIVTYPFVHVWTASVMRTARSLFLVLVGLNLFITVSFLMHVHWADGKAGGEYGIPYRLQSVDHSR